MLENVGPPKYVSPSHLCIRERENREDQSISSFVVYVRLSLSRAMGMEVCCTLGMLEKKQAEQLKTAGLTAYNHNLDTSREYYPNIITTRSYDERLKTLELVRDAGISVCSGIMSSSLRVHNSRQSDVSDIVF